MMPMTDKLQSELVVHPRVLSFERIVNFRDLGGYRTANGSTVRWGSVYRSGGLEHATEGDLAQLARLGICTVFDLRGEAESEGLPGRLEGVPGVRVVKLPMMTPEIALSTNVLGLLQQVARGRLDGIELMKDVYRSIVMRCGEQLAAIAQVCSFRACLPAVLHCTLGKDRTGVASAMLLTALGVPYADVVEDYLLTNACMAPHWAKLAGGRTVPPVFRRLTEARVEFLDAAYEAFRDGGDSVGGYFSGRLGLSGERAMRLASTLLDQRS